MPDETTQNAANVREWSRETVYGTRDDYDLAVGEVNRLNREHYGTSVFGIVETRAMRPQIRTTARWCILKRKVRDA